MHLSLDHVYYVKLVGIGRCPLREGADGSSLGLFNRSYVGRYKLIYD